MKQKKVREKYSRKVYHLYYPGKGEANQNAREMADERGPRNNKFGQNENNDWANVHWKVDWKRKREIISGKAKTWKKEYRTKLSFF